jgi:hypothetical protein
VDICRHFRAKTYLAGAGGHDYMDLSLFQKAGITVEFQDFTPPVYPQHWAKSSEDFVPGLSAIDLIFNCGPESLKILMGKTEQIRLTPAPSPQADDAAKSLPRERGGTQSGTSKRRQRPG